MSFERELHQSHFFFLLLFPSLSLYLFLSSHFSLLSSPLFLPFVAPVGDQGIAARVAPALPPVLLYRQEVGTQGQGPCSSCSSAVCDRRRCSSSSCPRRRRRRCCSRRRCSSSRLAKQRRRRSSRHGDPGLEPSGPGRGPRGLEDAAGARARGLPARRRREEEGGTSPASSRAPPCRRRFFPRGRPRGVRSRLGHLQSVQHLRVPPDALGALPLVLVFVLGGLFVQGGHGLEERGASSSSRNSSGRRSGNRRAAKRARRRNRSDFQGRQSRGVEPSWDKRAWGSPPRLRWLGLCCRRGVVKKEKERKFFFLKKKVESRGRSIFAPSQLCLLLLNSALFLLTFPTTERDLFDVLSRLRASEADLESTLMFSLPPFTLIVAMVRPTPIAAFAPPFAPARALDWPAFGFVFI